MVTSIRGRLHHAVWRAASRCRRYPAV